MSKLLDPKRWNREEFLNSVGIANEILELEMFIKKMFEGFDPGLFDERDIRARMAEGWEILTVGHWEEVRPWNESEARIHQIKAMPDGALMFGPNFVCIIPHDLRQARMDLINQMAAERTKKSVKAREEKARDRATIESSFESLTEVVTPPKKRG